MFILSIISKLTIEYHFTQTHASLQQTLECAILSKFPSKPVRISFVKVTNINI